MTAVGRLSGQPVEVLTGLPADVAAQLGDTWTVRRLREIAGAS